MVGVAFVLRHLGQRENECFCLEGFLDFEYPIIKHKIELTPQIDVEMQFLSAMTEKYKNEDITTIDGVKIDFPENRVHLRKSNTEPIIRIYTEAASQEKADALALRIIDEIKAIAGI